MGARLSADQPRRRRIERTDSEATIGWGTVDWYAAVVLYARDRDVPGHFSQAVPPT